MTTATPDQRIKTAQDHDVNAEAVELYLRRLQSQLCNSLAALDTGPGFHTDQVEHASGRGITAVLEKGEVFDRGGVNFSSVHGDCLPAAASERHPELAGFPFRAMGVSLVLHPKNPYVPTAHANVRFFTAEQEGKKPVWWFGGGLDLTPCYPFQEDCQHWHRECHNACAPFGKELYTRFKRWCDSYFYLPHRKETRGVGGLFFDDLVLESFDTSFAFLRSVGDCFSEAYVPLVKKRRDTPWGEREKSFQRYRRGRYVEFNLVYDRGTLFGLQTGGRTESILMSMPPEAHWRYDWHPEPGTPEADLYENYLQPRIWLPEES
ncbi:MAG: oxygen-dependent coproporphyrinogen oxidase [Kistimonas sp.]|nr:oxygen-dependent coproporphyrinogen oxidase [Kistimonas sp.]